MNIGKRTFSQFVKALVAKQHYIALINIFATCHNPLDCFKRYFFGTGIYPTRVPLRTPVGKISPEIYSYHDMLTINEIFCRLDYEVKNDIRVAVDIGSNIGISALYFLTRNQNAKCYLFEPDPKNVVKLTRNLENFTDRYVLRECAVSNENGLKQFGAEPTGRYGGLNRKTENYITVQCYHINEILNEILVDNNLIDVLKFDIEGDEFNLLRSIDEKILGKIKNIFFEIDHAVEMSADFSFHPGIFRQERYGQTLKLINRGFQG